MNFLRRRLRYILVHHVLHADDTPHQIALGVALSMLVAFLPLVGVQMIVALALASALRANKAVCIPIVWITNPLTMGPIYAGCWSLGRFITGSRDDRPLAQFMAQTEAHKGLSKLIAPEFWSEFFNLMISLGTDLWIGSAIVGTLLAIPSYFIAKRLIVYYREKHSFRNRRQAARLRLSRRTKSAVRTPTL